MTDVAPVLVLLVEDELALAETLKMSIKKMGFECIWARTLKEARSLIKTTKPELLVLDRQLPDGDGLELLKEAAFKALKVLVLSSKATMEERVKGLERGADDYLPKPFHWEELKARLNALLRRKESERAAGVNENTTVSEAIPLWTERPNNLEILTPTGWVVFTPLEYKFLTYVLEREGTIVSKDRLLREVWGFSFLPKTRTVDYLINQIRKRIEQEADRPKHLLTVRGAGVKFMK